MHNLLTTLLSSPITVKVRKPDPFAETSASGVVVEERLKYNYTYTVHTKVYPRFKTRHPILEAAEMFSEWLAGCEGPTHKRYPPNHSVREDDEDVETEVILLGHSMGGILAGDVVLLGPMHAAQDSDRDAGDARKRYRHNILGSVGFDTPFLGMHPGVVTSGVASLFRPNKEKEKADQNREKEREKAERDKEMERQKAEWDREKDRQKTEWDQEKVQNKAIRKSSDYGVGAGGSDVSLPLMASPYPPKHYNTGIPPSSVLQGGFASGFAGVKNFLKKHSGNIPGAAVQYMLSHMEYAGCLADPSGLNGRYRKLRTLEDGVSGGNLGAGVWGPGYRSRFVNYYTVCWGYGYGYGGKPVTDNDSGCLGAETVPGIVIGNKEIGTISTTGAGLSRSSTQKVRGTSPAPSHRRIQSASSVTSFQSLDAPLTAMGVKRHSSQSTHGFTGPRLLVPPEGVVRVSPSPSPPSPPSPQVAALPSFVDPSGEKPASALTPANTFDLINERSAKFSLPNLPPPPIPPPLIDAEDLHHITDKRHQKAHMKESKALWKEYMRQEKAWGKMVRDREKVLEKLEPRPPPGVVPTAAEQQQTKLVKEKPGTTVPTPAEAAPKITKRERKFCIIPREAKTPKLPEGGLTSAVATQLPQDNTWVKVPMYNVDEVAAHCALFMAGTEIFEQEREEIRSEEQSGVASAPPGLGTHHEGVHHQSEQQPRASLPAQPTQPPPPPPPPPSAPAAINPAPTSTKHNITSRFKEMDLSDSSDAESMEDKPDCPTGGDTIAVPAVPAIPALTPEEEEKRELDIKRRQYERLVGDVAARIEGWVKENVIMCLHEAQRRDGARVKFDDGESGRRALGRSGTAGSMESLATMNLPKKWG